jgi:hypothetical protein
MVRKKKIKYPLYFEYVISFSNIDEIVRQVICYGYSIGNCVRDYIIGTNFIMSGSKKFYVYKVYLSLSKPLKVTPIDFNITIENVFVYRPDYKEPFEYYITILNIADFAIGRNPAFYGSFTVPITTKLRFSNRIKNVLYKKWKDYKSYKGAMIKVELTYNTRTMFYNTLNLTRQGLIYEALDLIKNENPFEYIRGAEDYEAKLQSIQLQMLGFRKKYNLEPYTIPLKISELFDNIIFWKDNISTPKVLVLVGYFNSSKTKVILSFIQNDLKLDVLNILNLNSPLFLSRNTILFVNDINISLDQIDISTQLGLIARKNVGNQIIELILNNISYNSIVSVNFNNSFSKEIIDNLIIYDLDNDFMYYLGNLVETKSLKDYFLLKKKTLGFKDKIISKCHRIFDAIFSLD